MDRQPLFDQIKKKRVSRLLIEDSQLEISWVVCVYVLSSVQSLSHA